MAISSDFGNDVEQAIVQRLMDDTELRVLIKGEVHPSHLSELDQADRTFPLVTLRQAGGARLDWNEVFFRQTYQVTAWSDRSYNEAMKVRDAVRRALHGKRLELGDAALVVKTQNLGQNILDPQASLYYSSAQARVSALDLSAAV